MDYILHLLILIVTTSILCITLNFISGYAGILSLAHATFSGIGAYAVSLLMLNLHIPFLLALLCGCIVSGFIGFILAFPLLQLKSDRLVLITIGFTLIVYNIMLNWVSLTGGPLGLKGIPFPKIFGYHFDDKYSFLGLALFALLITYLIFQKLVNSPYGVILKGIRENETVAKVYGHNARFFKHQAFTISTFFAGMAGGLFATYIHYLEPSSFDLMHSVRLLVIIILGGMANLKGTILGAIIIVLFPESLRFIGLPSSIMAETQQILYGMLLILLMMFRPKGIMGEYKI